VISLNDESPSNRRKEVKSPASAGPFHAKHPASAGLLSPLAIPRLSPGVSLVDPLAISE